MSLRMINEVEGFTLGPFKDSGFENLRVIGAVSFTGRGAHVALFGAGRVFMCEADSSPC